jgi:hypothetical protein
VVWVGAMVSAGLLMVLLFFSFIGEVNFAYAYVAGVLIVFLAAYFLVTWAPSSTRGSRGTPAPRTASGAASKGS